MPTLTYIASPYSHESHESHEVMRHRFEAVCDYAGQQMTAGNVVYSPIAHSHPIAVRGGLPTDWGFWQTFDHVMLTRCDAMTVLMLPGWDESVGVKSEVATALALGISVDYESWESDE